MAWKGADIAVSDFVSRVIPLHSFPELHVHRTSGFVLVVLVLFLIAGFASLNDALLYTPDSARYLIWAASIADGDGYSDVTSPEPTRYVIHAPLYSPYR